jgi:hypothetical protein
MEQNVVQLPFPEQDKLVCTECLAHVGIPCDCDAPFKRMTPGERARIGVEKWPELSDREIADRLQIGYTTVARARPTTDPNGSVATILPQRRLGQDGKLRSMPQKSTSIKKVGCDPVLTRNQSVNGALVAVYDFIVYEGWSDHQLALFVQACQKLHARAKGSIQWYDAVERRKAAKRKVKKRLENT